MFRTRSMLELSGNVILIVLAMGSPRGGKLKWSAMIGMTIPANHREATIAQLKLNTAIAGPILVFEMPEGTNPTQGELSAFPRILL
jgi:hypothetical protein